MYSKIYLKYLDGYSISTQSKKPYLITRPKSMKKFRNCGMSTLIILKVSDRSACI